MPELPTILASNPVSVPEQVIEAKTFDKLKLATLVVRSFEINGEATADVELVRFRTLPDGSREWDGGPSITFSVPNLMAEAANDEELATVMYLLLEYVKKKGRELNLIAPAE